MKEGTVQERLVEVFEALRSAYGPRLWWPVTSEGETVPRYTGGPRNPAQVFEVAVGALLTQNTAWRNASRAIENLNRKNLLSPEGIIGLPIGRLAALIRPAGYYNQKARRLRTLARFFLSGDPVTRESLLRLDGVGPETADSILLYAFGSPRFVVDAYTIRLFERLGMLTGGIRYGEVQDLFEAHLPRSTPLYQEFHALIVEHGKRHCRKKPLCEDCVVRHGCAWAKRGGTRTGKRP